MATKHLPRRALVVGFCLGLGVAVDTNESAAVYERIPGMRCQRTGEHTYTYLAQPYGSWLENNSGTAQSYACPIPSTEDLPLEDIATVLIDVYDGNSASSQNDAGMMVKARICSYALIPPSSEFNYCNDQEGITNSSLTFSGPARLAIDVFDQGFDANDSVYLRVQLPPLGGSASRISSIYISD